MLLKSVCLGDWILLLDASQVAKTPHLKLLKGPVAGAASGSTLRSSCSRTGRPSCGSIPGTASAAGAAAATTAASGILLAALVVLAEARLACFAARRLCSLDRPHRTRAPPTATAARGPASCSHCMPCLMAPLQQRKNRKACECARHEATGPVVCRAHQLCWLKQVPGINLTCECSYTCVNISEQTSHSDHL